MRSSMIKLALVAAVSGIVVLPAQAQSTPHTFYFAMDAGMAAERAQLGVRSDIGVALAATIGRRLAGGLAVEASVGGARFGAAEESISPGGCLGVVPCSPPAPSPVHVITFGGNAIYTASSSHVAPILLAGAGVRYLSEAPEQSSETRPYAEFGAGIAMPIGAASWRISARMQVAPSTRGLPRWTVPIMTGVQF